MAFTFASLSTNILIIMEYFYIVALLLLLK